MTRLLLAVAAFGFAVYCVAKVCHGLRTGSLRALARGLPYFVRTREPFWFWFAVVLNSFLALCALYLGAVAGIRWIEAR